VWREQSNYYKNAREPRDPNDNPLNVYTLTFGGGLDNTTPMGTFNMSRSDTQILYVTLSAIANDSRSNSRKAYIIVYAEAWNVFSIKDGKGHLMFAD
jgi:hypothetical protein